MFLPMSWTSPFTVAMRTRPWVRAFAAAGERGGFLSLHEREKPRDGFFHHACAFHDLRQEHFSRAEEIADDAHAGHERAFDDEEWSLVFHARFLGVGIDEIHDALDQGVLEDVPRRNRSARLQVGHGMAAFVPLALFLDGRRRM